jgi:hypothetical protein
MYDVIYNEVFDDLDLKVFDEMEEDTIKSKKRAELISYMEKNRDKYYLKLNSIVNLKNDVSGFSKKEKFRIPRNVKRYTKIVDYIINKL